MPYNIGGQWPIDPKFPVTFEFGASPQWYLDIFKEPHNGIDLGCPVGTPVQATDDGEVLNADYTPDSDGLGVCLIHSWGKSYYWHLSRPSVKYMDKVKKGDTIGISGSTGIATGPHLHFATLLNNPTGENIRHFVNPREVATLQSVEVPEPEPQYKTYWVQKGDNLWKIAVNHYAQGPLWPIIYDANRDIIKDPNLIYPGQKLRIPPKP